MSERMTTFTSVEQALREVVDSGSDIVPSMQLLDYQRPESLISTRQLTTLLPIEGLSVEGTEVAEIDVRNRLVKEHTYIAGAIGAYYGQRYTEFGHLMAVEDLTQSAAVGLIIATDKFDPSQARYGVKGYRRYVTEGARYTLLDEVTAVQNDALYYADPFATIECSCSIDTPLPVEEQAFHAIALEQVRDAMQNLTEKEQIVIFHRFGFDGEEQSIGEAGQTIGLDRYESSNLHYGALRKLRRELTDYRPEDV